MNPPAPACAPAPPVLPIPRLAPAGAPLAILMLVALVACSTPRPPAPAPAAAAPAAVSAPEPAPAPAPAPVPSPPPAPAQPEPLSGAQEVQRALVAALDFLQAGQEEPAEAELKRVLAADAGNRPAQSLMRQIREDPQTLLGRESFSYKVQPGESLSALARRFLNDPLLFYALARYNNLKVPRTLAGGSTIRVPGKAPAATPVPSAPPGAGPTAAAAAQPGAVSASAAASAGGPPAAAQAPVAMESDAARAARSKSEAVALHTRAARAAFAKQDLDGALRSWDAVLAVDPDNRTALLERQKTQGLKERLGRVK